MSDLALTKALDEIQVLKKKLDKAILQRDSYIEFYFDDEHENDDAAFDRNVKGAKDLFNQAIEEIK